MGRWPRSFVASVIFDEDRFALHRDINFRGSSQTWVRFWAPTPLALRVAVRPTPTPPPPSFAGMVSSSRADTFYSADGGTIVVDTSVPYVSGCVDGLREVTKRQRQNNSNERRSNRLFDRNTW